jgi:hypothetical protein
MRTTFLVPRCGGQLGEERADLWCGLARFLQAITAGSAGLSMATTSPASASTDTTIVALIHKPSRSLFTVQSPFRLGLSRAVFW